MIDQFIGLEEILKVLIKDLGHPLRDHEDPKKIITDEQRYHNVMKALIGTYHKPNASKPPYVISYDEAEKILLLTNKTRNISDSIQRILEKRYGPVTDSKAVQRDAMIETIRKNLRENKGAYMWSNPKAFGLEQFIPTPEEKQKNNQQVKNIMDAMLNAGWSAHWEKK